MNWFLFFVAVVVIVLGCLAFSVTWTPLFVLTPWLLLVLGATFLLMSFKKPLLPSWKYPRPADMNEVQAGLIEKFFGQFEVVERYCKKQGCLEQFFQQEDKLHLLIQACLAVGVSREYLQKFLEPRGYPYFTMGRGSGKTFKTIG